MKSLASRRGFIQTAIKGLVAPMLITGVFKFDAYAGEYFMSDGSMVSKADLDKIQELLKGKKPVSWVFAGDSITQGAKHTNGLRSYPEIFAERVRWEMGRVRDVVINTAVSGNTSQDVLTDFDWRVAQFKPHVVSLMLGTNDAAIQKNINKAAFNKNMTALIDNIRQIGAVPILQTPNPIIIEKAKERSALPEYTTEIRNMATKHQVILIDQYANWEEPANLNDRKDWLNDPLHPNGLGHLKMARQMFRELSIFDPKSFTCSGEI